MIFFFFFHFLRLYWIYFQIKFETLLFFCIIYFSVEIYWKKYHTNNWNILFFFFFFVRIVVRNDRKSHVLREKLEGMQFFAVTSVVLYRFTYLYYTNLYINVWKKERNKFVSISMHYKLYGLKDKIQQLLTVSSTGYVKWNENIFIEIKEHGNYIQYVYTIYIV